MSLDKIYQTNSNFLRVDDLQGKSPVLTISQAEIVTKDYEDGNGPKTQIVLSFQGTEKVLGLNKTNAYRIADLLGTEEESDWVGASIKLYRDMTTYQGKPTPCIRIFPELPPQPQDQSQAKGKAKGKAAGVDPNDPLYSGPDIEDSSDDIPW